MANLTIVVEEQLLQAARVKAAQQGTSVNEVCREAIARFARSEQDAGLRAERVRALLERAAPPTRAAWQGRGRFYDEVLAERGLAGAKAAKPVRSGRR